MMLTWEQIAEKIAAMSPAERAKPALRFDTTIGEFFTMSTIDEADGWVDLFERHVNDGVTKNTPIIIENDFIFEGVK